MDLFLNIFMESQNVFKGSNIELNIYEKANLDIWFFPEYLKYNKAAR